MRIFAAIVPPPQVVEDLDEFLAPRRESGGASPGPRWAAPEQFHITLAFAGEARGSDVEEAQEAIEQVTRRRGPLELRLRGAGAFPGPGHARTLWLGVETVSGDAVPPLSEGPSLSNGPTSSNGPWPSNGPTSSDGPAPSDGPTSTDGPAPSHGPASLGGPSSPDGPLTSLANAVRTAARGTGVAAEGGPFVPHLTVARFGRPADATKWLRVLDTYTSVSWEADEVVLFASYLGQGRGGRPRHEELAVFPLLGD